MTNFCPGHSSSFHCPSNIEISLPKPTSGMTLTIQFFLDKNKLNSLVPQCNPLSTTESHKAERGKRKPLLETQ